MDPLPLTPLCHLNIETQQKTYSCAVLLILAELTHATKLVDKFFLRDVTARQQVVQAHVRAMMSGAITVDAMFALLWEEGYPLDAGVAGRVSELLSEARAVWGVPA